MLILLKEVHFIIATPYLNYMDKNNQRPQVKINGTNIRNNEHLQFCKDYLIVVLLLI